MPISHCFGVHWSGDVFTLGLHTGSMQATNYTCNSEKKTEDLDEVKFDTLIRWYQYSEFCLEGYQRAAVAGNVR